MRKLKLSIEELQVESFSPTAAPGEPGTVRGQQLTTDPYNDDPSYEYCAPSRGNVHTNCCPATWKQTCPYSCYQTGECGNSCDTWWWCGTCWSCMHTCEHAASCTDACANCGS